MPRLPLTDEQKTAAGSRHRRLFIEAHPGSGKTTVAAERFGIVRFDRVPHEPRAVTALSFTRSALYGFRGAKPDLVPSVLTEHGFQTLPLSRSFRFRTASMRELSTALRGGQAVTIATGEAHDVVLASKWDTLWNAPAHVLPLSFGRTTNKTDAIAILLLDHLVHAAFSARAVFLPEALALLELDPETYRTRGPAVLGAVAELLKGSAPDAPGQALDALRSAVRTLGGLRRPPSGRGGAGGGPQLERLSAMADRLRAPMLVPGLTIHQAKGREWDTVGVLLEPDEIQITCAGLDPSIETHRAMYVALTRARRGVTTLA